MVKINDGMKGGNCKPSNIARKIAQAFSFNWRDSRERFVLFYIGAGLVFFRLKSAKDKSNCITL